MVAGAVDARVATLSMRERGPVPVIALIPPDRAPRLASVLPAGTRLVRLERLEDLPALLEGGAAAVVLDPLLIDPTSPEVPRILPMLARCASVIMYTSLTPDAVHRLVDLRPLVGTVLVLAGVDDGPESLRRVLRSVGDTTHRVRILDELHACAGPLPADVSVALSGLLEAGGRDLTVHRLAESAHMSARTLERRLALARAPSAVWLMRAARALLARELLRSSPLTVRQVARGVGYARLDSLRSLLRWSFGTSPSSLRRGHCSRPGPSWSGSRAS